MKEKRTVESILEEFNRDAENSKLTNETLRVKYIKSILKDHLDMEGLSDEEVENYRDLEDKIDGMIQKRDDSLIRIDEKLLNLQHDIRRGFRAFKLQDGTDIAIKFPTIVDDEEIANISSRTYNKLIVDRDFLTEEEILRVLDERGVYTKADDKKLDALIEDYKEIAFKLNSEYTRDKKSEKRLAQYRKELEEIRDAYQELSSKKIRHTINSIETKVEERALREKLVRCSYNVDVSGDEPKLLDRIWKTQEELEEPSAKPKVIEVYSLAQNYWAGLDASIIDEPLSEESEGGSESEK